MSSSELDFLLESLEFLPDICTAINRCNENFLNVSFYIDSVDLFDCRIIFVLNLENGTRTTLKVNAIDLFRNLDIDLDLTVKWLAQDVLDSVEIFEEKQNAYPSPLKKN